MKRWLAVVATHAQLARQHEKEAFHFHNLLRVMMIRVQMFILCPEVKTAMAVN